jgi:hypothetical protein
MAMGELTFARGAVTRFAPPAASGSSVIIRRRRKHFWVAARSPSPAGSLVGETRTIMASIAEALSAAGLGFDAVCKATTHYVGSRSAEDLHDNMTVRNAYYRFPGPASTGLPVAAFPFSSSRIAVDLLGVVD